VSEPHTYHENGNRSYYSYIRQKFTGQADTMHVLSNVTVAALAHTLAGGLGID